MRASLAAAFTAASVCLTLTSAALAQDPAPDGGTATPPPAATPPPPAPAAPPPATRRSPVGLSTLRVMHDKGILTDAEYASALHDVGDSTGARAADANSVVMGRWSLSLYGFVEADSILDSTQSFGALAGNAVLVRPSGHPAPLPATQSTYTAENGRVQFGVSNSRFGLRLRAPEVSHVRASATLEMDFMGYDPGPSYGSGSGRSEGAVFTSPTLRVRHANVKIETPIVDVLIGQYWHLFGWQSDFHPNSVQIQGLPGQLYARTPQIRLSHAFKLGPTTLELAAAALRPPERDSMIPDGVAGLRFAIDEWTGLATSGSTGTSIRPAAIAVTGDMRTFVLPSFAQVPTDGVTLTTASVAGDVFLPVIPATKKKMGNSLSLTGEVVMGSGIADLYTGLTGGLTFPTLPNKTGLNPPPAYPQNIDNGLVVFDNVNQDLHPIQWNTFMVGLQYYLPGLKGRVWISGNYSHTESPNIELYTRPVSVLPNPNNSDYVSAAAVRKFEDFFDVNAFFDPLPGVRVGLEYAYFNDRFVDGAHSVNHRGQVSAFFVF